MLTINRLSQSAFAIVTVLHITATTTANPDEELKRVGLGPEELGMLNDFEVKLLRDSIRGVGSVSKLGGVDFSKLIQGALPELSLGPPQKINEQEEEEEIPVGGGFLGGEPEIIMPELPKQRDEKIPVKTGTIHKLKPRKKKPKKPTLTEDNTDLTTDEQQRLTKLIEALLAKKKQSEKAQSTEWESEEEESKGEDEEPEELTPTTTPTTTKKQTTTGRQPTTLTQQSKWSVQETKKKSDGERKGLTMITDQKGKGSAEFVVTDQKEITQHPQIAKSAIWRENSENLSENTEEAFDQQIVDNEVHGDPKAWEERMRALTRELSSVLLKLKAEKEANGETKKTIYDARTAIQTVPEVVDGHTNSIELVSNVSMRPRKAFVSILREGLARQTDINEYVFVGSITLVRDSDKVILVDTGLATDINGRTDLLNKLAKLQIAPPQVNYVVTTHGHPDHSGNTNDFPDAVHFQGNMLHYRTKFNFSDLFEKDIHEITPNVHLLKSPGHTPDDIAVLVRNTDKYGTMAVAGDVFIAEEDKDFPLMWKPMAWNERVQERSRNRLICEADYIVPGHGKVFKVSDDMRTKAKCNSTHVNIG